MSAANTARTLSIVLWAALALSLLAWGLIGYSWILCTIAIVPMLAPLHGLVRGRRYTYAWATLFSVPYLAFSITELLANPAARWAAGCTLILVFGWFCSMVLYLRASRAHRE